MTQEDVTQARRDEECDSHQRQAEAAARTRTARADVMRTFLRLQHKLEECFSQHAFEDYVAKYMNDRLPAEEVEQNGEQLVDLLEGLLPDDDRIEPKTLHDLVERFENERQGLDAADIDEQLKRILPLDLEEQFEERVRRLTREQL